MSSPQDIDENGSITGALAPVGGVTVFRHMVFEGRLVHTLDYVVLVHLLFAKAEGRPLTVLKLWEELKKQGIRSAKNATRLVGRDAVYESFARLIEAGYVRRVPVPNKVAGKTPTVAYEVFDNPAWNPDWQAAQAGAVFPAGGQDGRTSEEPQVSTLPGTPDPGTPDPAFREVVSGVFPQVGTLPAFRDARSLPPHTPRRRWKPPPPTPSPSSVGRWTRLRRVGGRRNRLRPSLPSSSRRPSRSSVACGIRSPVEPRWRQSWLRCYCRPSRTTAGSSATSWRPS